MMIIGILIGLAAGLMVWRFAKRKKAHLEEPEKPKERRPDIGACENQGE